METSGIVFIRELTRWGDLPLSETLKNELAAQGFFNGTAFRFVGLYYSARENMVVAGYPKYRPVPATSRDRRETLDEIGQICRLAAQAGLPSSPVFDDLFQPFAPQGADRRTSPYELSVFLMRDYAENGLYRERSCEIRRDGVGRRSWTRTIRYTQPVFAEEPLYLNPITVRSRRADDRDITPLHAHVVRQCARLLGPLGLGQGVRLPEGGEIWEEEDLTRYVPAINARLSRTYADRELRLLRALRTWCGMSADHRARFGVVCPELLWEYAAKRYFGNIARTASGTPWYYALTEAGDYERYAGAGQAIPDILYAGTGGDGRRGLAIFDAKYYVPRWDRAGGRVYGAPPNADIAKQIQYFHSLRQRWPEAAVEFGNAFLLPCPLEDRLYRYGGCAMENDRQSREIGGLLPGLGPPEGPRDLVLFYLVDPRRLWEACLRGESVSREEIFSEFIPRFRQERERA